MTTSTTMTRATRVMGIHRWIALSAGLTTMFGLGNLVPFPALTVYEAWGATCVSLAAIVHVARKFSPNEQVAVCRCVSVMFATEALVFVSEGLAPTVDYSGSDASSDAIPYFVGLFVSLCLAYLWASLEKLNTPDVSTTSQSTRTWLSLVLSFHAMTAILVGILSVVYPQFVNVFEQPLSFTPDPEELFAIRCWGAFIMGFGLLSAVVAGFDCKSQRTYGIIMIAFFTSLNVVFGKEWNQLNMTYRLGSFPLFTIFILLYATALAKSTTATHSKKE